MTCFYAVTFLRLLAFLAANSVQTIIFWLRYQYYALGHVFLNVLYFSETPPNVDFPYCTSMSTCRQGMINALY